MAWIGMLGACLVAVSLLVYAAAALAELLLCEHTSCLVDRLCR
jgi:hypothetical protein